MENGRDGSAVTVAKDPALMAEEWSGGELGC